MRRRLLIEPFVIKEPEINLHRTSRIATKITEHPSHSATDNTNCLNTYGALSEVPESSQKIPTLQ